MQLSRSQSLAPLGNIELEAEKPIGDATANKEVEELGRFAVEENNKKGNALEFVKVVQAAQQDTKYFLKIEASDKGEKKTFSAVVLLQSGKKELCHVGYRVPPVPCYMLTWLTRGYNASPDPRYTPRRGIVPPLLSAIHGHSSVTPYDMYRCGSTNNQYGNIVSSSRGRHSSANFFDHMEMPSTQPSVQFSFDTMASSSRGRHSTASFFDLNVDMPSSSRGRHASKSPQFNSDDDEVLGNVAQTDPPAHMYEADYGAMYGPEFADMPHLIQSQSIDDQKICMLLCPTRKRIQLDGSRIENEEEKQHMELTVYNGPHTCCARGVNQDHPNLDSEMICQAIMPMVKTSSHIAVAMLISAIQSQYGYTISYKKAWLAKQNVIVKLHGECDTSYNELPGYELLPRTFESMLQDLRAKNEEGYDYISLIDKEMWTNAYDGGYRYGHMTTNLAEAINSTLKGAHHLPIAALVKTTYFRLGALFAKLGGQAQTWMQGGHVYHPRLVADLQKKLLHQMECL
ncbi:Cysteine proteinase inhibitor [Hibiscus syriacus]|uniref:Cysteine proteinase inhibitor n=1 Tax=Hibiscus syriacus TaxID=106335 RepID=A0A6A2WU27_HIBSY|nr:Cysteine proteinase inhibitor [Hibiscus syriacus]